MDREGIANQLPNSVSFKLCIMKQKEKDFRENIQKFRASAKKFHCDIKLPFYWQLIQECMESNDENAFYIIQQCEDFIDLKIKSLEIKFGIKSS